MGLSEPQHVTSVGAPTDVPATAAPAASASLGSGTLGDGAAGAEGAPPGSTPLWMDAAPPRVKDRRGAVATPRSGLHTAFFFGLIALAVGAAGIFAIMYWGPEKPIRSRTQLASNPPPIAELPSFASASAGATGAPEAAPSASASADAASSAIAADAEPSASASSGARKPKKAPPRAPKKPAH